MTYIMRQYRRTAANWAATNPVLIEGEVGIEVDTGRTKMGDGVTAWSALPVWPPYAVITGGSIGGVGVAALGAAATLRRRPTTAHPSPPAISYSATAPATGKVLAPWDENAQVVGAAASFNSASAIVNLSSVGFCGIDRYLTGDTITLGWRCQTSAAERVMVYVDDLPCMASPATPSVGTVAGAYYYVTLAFGSIARRRVEILISSAAALVGLYTAHTGAIEPGPLRRKVHLVGDSFLGGSAAISTSSDLPACQLAMLYDASVSCSGLGGTGYVSAGSFTTFGSAARVADAALVQPHEIVFMGSVNDDGQSGIAAAAAACWAAYKAGVPNARITVLGPQPTDATGTLNANRTANNQAVYSAASASANVARFMDLIGTKSGAPSRAFAAFTFYNPGEVISNIGSVWRHDQTVAAQYPATYAPGQVNSAVWTLLTHDLYGTGRAGATAGDGTRDTFVYSDGIHPTAVACASYAARIGSVIEAPRS